MDDGHHGVVQLFELHFFDGNDIDLEALQQDHFFAWCELLLIVLHVIVSGEVDSETCHTDLVLNVYLDDDWLKVGFAAR